MQLCGYVASCGAAVLLGGLLLNDGPLAWAGLALFAAPCLVALVAEARRAQRRTD